MGDMNIFALHLTADNGKQKGLNVISFWYKEIATIAKPSNWIEKQAEFFY